MKTSILFCCLMIVGGLAFGQKTLPDPGGSTTPNTGAPVGGSNGASGGSSSGSGTVSSSGSGAVSSNDDGYFQLWLDLVNVFVELTNAEKEEDE
ncbi:MAG TPA: hypothetical protein VGQ59_00115 [Cyclobacteriaceae bacterium]|jgi:hypothetical protein|nr:hypothetical protein [Cyclobacteriaceae bacterium]